MQLPSEVVHAATGAALQSLRARKLLTFRALEGRAEEGPQWQAPRMGSSVFESGMETRAGIDLFGRLQQAHEGGIRGMRNDRHHHGSRHLIFMVIQVCCSATWGNKMGTQLGATSLED